MALRWWDGACGGMQCMLVRRQDGWWYCRIYVACSPLRAEQQGVGQWWGLQGISVWLEGAVGHGKQLLMHQACVGDGMGWWDLCHDLDYHFSFP